VGLFTRLGVGQLAELLLVLGDFALQLSDLGAVNTYPPGVGDQVFFLDLDVDPGVECGLARCGHRSPISSSFASICAILSARLRRPPHITPRSDVSLMSRRPS